MDSRRAWCGRVLASLCAWLALHVGAAPPRIGVLSFGAPPSHTTDPNLHDAFRQGLSEAGWSEGQNLAIEWRYGFGDPAKLRAAAEEFPHTAHAGMLLSYGPDLHDLGRRSGALVDKILRGARVGDVPIERPQKLSLVINQRTARTLGLTMPRALLMRADEVVE